MMKRIGITLLALCLLVTALAACGNDKKKNEDAGSSSPVSEAVQAATPTPSPTPARTAKAAKVNADGGLNIRSQPSTEGEILDLAEDGDLLPLLVEKPSDGWYQVDYQGKTAYISADYASVVEITLEEYNQLKAALAATPAPEAGETLAPTPTPNTDDPANQGVLTPPVDQQQTESAATAEDGE